LGKVIWSDIQYNIEPQGNGFAIAIRDILSLSGYNAKYSFNDETVESMNSIYFCQVKRP